jgi:hypothetical protein
VVTGMTSTGLSPEWDRWFDEAFTDLVAQDDELIRQEFDALISASWEHRPPAPPAPPTGPFNAESREGRSAYRGTHSTGAPSDEPQPPPE